MAHATTTADLPTRRVESVSAGLRAAVPALVALGVLAFAAALMTDGQRALRAYLFNWLFFTTVAQGAVMLAVIVIIAKGMWSRTSRRFALGFVAYLPVAYLLLLPIYIGAGDLFPWVEHVDPPGKAAYLNVPFMIARHVILLGIVLALSLAFAYWSLRPDLGALKDQASGRVRALYDRMTQGWRGQEAEEALAHRRTQVIAPILAISYALGFSVVAWDFVMSLESHWYSTMIGPYLFMGGILGGIAATAITTIVLTGRLGLRDVIPENHFHDLGKMVFAFSVFWAYLYFSQFIVIWYGNLEHEQTFIAHRYDMPFRPVAQLSFACMFVIPFFGLLGVKAKKTPKILATFAGIVLFGLWIERYFLIYPSFYQGAPDMPFGWQEIGIALLFAGLFLGSLLWFFTRFPVFQQWIPATEIELEGVDVEVPARAP
jgi:hypothetical protein